MNLFYTFLAALNYLAVIHCKWIKMFGSLMYYYIPNLAWPYKKQVIKCCSELHLRNLANPKLLMLSVRTWEMLLLILLSPLIETRIRWVGGLGRGIARGFGVFHLWRGQDRKPASSGSISRKAEEGAVLNSHYQDGKKMAEALQQFVWDNVVQ